MTPEQIGQLFQAFTQADAVDHARITAAPASGWRITRHFCQMMGGDVAVESEPGRGSTFTITLPAGRREAEADDGSARRATGGGAGGTVLVIDDDRGHPRAAASVSSAQEGFRVLARRRRQEGLRLARGGRARRRSRST